MTDKQRLLCFLLDPSPYPGLIQMAGAFFHIFFIKKVSVLYKIQPFSLQVIFIIDENLSEK